MAKILIWETIWLIENSAVNKIHCYFLPSWPFKVWWKPRWNSHWIFSLSLSFWLSLSPFLGLSLSDSLYLSFLASLSLSFFDSLSLFLWLSLFLSWPLFIFLGQPLSYSSGFLMHLLSCSKPEHPSLHILSCCPCIQTLSLSLSISHTFCCNQEYNSRAISVGWKFKLLTQPRLRSRFTTLTREDKLRWWLKKLSKEVNLK